MIRNLKTLGLALCAVLVLTAVAASAAAAEGKYTASAYPTTGTGTSAFGNDTFITAVGTVECAVHFESTLTASSSSLTVKAAYTGCKFAGFNATVNMGSCAFLLTTPTGSNPDTGTAPLDIACTSGAITVTAGPCTLTIGPQGPLNHVSATNDTAAGDVTAQADIPNSINYTVTVDNFGCPFAGTGVKTEASYIQHEPITIDSTNGQSIHVG
jgi:hypothetical protein